jgi:DNA-binding NarL/FixJ family response regulator
MLETTIAICDTEPVAIEGLRCLLGTAERLRVVAAETCLSDGIEAAGELKPSILVLDKGFGMQPLLDALRVLHLPESGLRVVVWGANISDAEALRLLHAGAMGVIRKTASLDAMLECFAAVSSGMSWVEDGLIRSTGGLHRSNTPLTAREAQVADLVERGMTNREIACELGIRTGTVKIHLKHIFEKTGVHGRYGLALCGLKEKGILLAPALV